MKEVLNKEVVIFTGNRAEFGILFPLLIELRSYYNISLVVSGSHLLEPWMTISEINSKINRNKLNISIIKIPLNQLDDPYINSLNCIYEKSLNILKKSFCFSIVLGDRIESFGFAIASFIRNVPIVHLYGGDIVNVPYFDTNIRHSITKIAHLHFVTNSESAKVLMQMGEEKWRVFNVGILSYDYDRLNLIPSKQEMTESLELQENEIYVLLTYHSAHYKSADQNLHDFLIVLETLEKSQMKIILTFPNNDPGGEKMVSYIQSLETSDNIKIIPNLGTERMLSFFKYFKTIVCGNSSSGIIETCFYNVPSINVGDRQTDRFRGENVYDCEINSESLFSLLIYIKDNYFTLKDKFKKSSEFFGNGYAAVRIRETLGNLNEESKSRILFKKFELKQFV